MGSGGKTVKAFVRHSLSSPKQAAISMTTAAVALGVGLSVILSRTLIDNFLTVVISMILCFSIYMQSDWLMPAVERVNRSVVWRIPTTEPVAALTIDDVPLFDQPTSLEEILDVLKSHQVTATFMIMSGFVQLEKDGGMDVSSRERCRKLLERAVAEGHELANHLQFDRPAFAMTDAEFDEAFLHCDSFLADMAGGEEAWRARPRRWFRPASALWNDHMLKFAEAHGYTTVISNCHPFDAAPSSRFLNPAYLKANVAPGSVICVHDRWHTAKTLDKALPAIQQRGLKVTTLSELQRVADEHPRSVACEPAGKAKQG